MASKVPPRDTALVCEHCETLLNRIIATGLVHGHDVATLRTPRRELTVSYPVTMDDGSVKIFTGWRIQYNDSRGPTKGGIRIHHTANEDDVGELAFLMMLKTALVDIPYGGAKGAIRLDPNMVSEREFEHIVRGYIRQIAPIIGPERDIPAPDVNVTPETISLMLDEYERVVGHKEPSAFTGKPFALGGSLGRESATAVGGFAVIEAWARERTRKDLRVALQGFGNVGGHLAKLLHDAGYTIIAVSEARGGLVNPEGINMSALINWKNDGNAITEFAQTPEGRGGKAVGSDDVLTVETDILIPAALGGVITEKNVDSVHAQIIVEMANAPVTPEADTILKEKRVLVMPDILANAGGVIVSYFEWVQNRAGEQWTQEKVETKLKETISRAHKEVHEEMERRHRYDMRTVCYLIALRRILEAEKK